MTDTQAKALMGDMLSTYRARILEEIADRLEYRAGEERQWAEEAAANGDHEVRRLHTYAYRALKDEADKIRAQAKELRGG